MKKNDIRSKIEFLLNISEVYETVFREVVNEFDKAVNDENLSASENAIERINLANIIAKTRNASCNAEEIIKELEDKKLFSRADIQDNDSYVPPIKISGNDSALKMTVSNKEQTNFIEAMSVNFAEHPGISLTYSNNNGQAANMALAEIKSKEFCKECGISDKGLAELYIWDDMENDDYTNKYSYPGSVLSSLE